VAWHDDHYGHVDQGILSVLTGKLSKFMRVEWDARNPSLGDRQQVVLLTDRYITELVVE